MTDRPRRYRSLQSDDRSVSDAVGYVLTFSVVVVAVATASGVGFEQLEAIQENEEITNAERAFQLIEQNFDQIQQSQAQSRRSEIALESGDLRLLEPSSTSTMSITINVSDGSQVTRTVRMNTLQYEVDETTIAFEGGAVFYQDENQNTILEDGPELFCRNRGSDPGRAIVSVVRLDGQSDVAFSGGTIGITGEYNGTRLLFPLNRTGQDSAGDATNVTVEIDSEYSGAWADHFTDDETGWQQLGADTYRCDDDHGIQVFVRQTRLDVRFSR
ncbi:MAG: hypothetical protein V5A45_03220 [Haloarculaceae archaeon]